MHSVAVVGAGAAGCLVAMRLLEAARVRVVLIDEAEEPGRGVAFGTTDPRHLLNVPAGNMSARAEDPGDFLDWLAAHGHPDLGPGDFASRGDYGAYLGQRLAEADERTGSRLERLHRRVTGLDLSAGGHRLLLDDGTSLAADAVVLAMGLFVPSDDWVPAGLADSPHLIRDPWRAGALAGLPGDRDVLLVGTGLTMVDVALSLAGPGRVVHAVSRHGLLPAAHLRAPSPPLPAPDLQGLTTLDGVRAAIGAHVDAAVAQGGDWRPAIDGLRPQISTVWQSLTESDRGRFLREDLRGWEVRRHRMAPPSDAALRRHLGSGAVRLHTGHVDAVQEEPDGLIVSLTCGEVVSAAAAVGCTGARMDPRRADDPFVEDLLAQGAARPGPAGLGLDTGDDGRLRDALGRPHDAIWTLASLRRGNLWETTAIPEIRVQAAEVATAVLSVLEEGAAAQKLPTPRPPHDRFGLRLSTTPEAAEAYSLALEAVLHLEAGAQGHLEDAVRRDPDFALGQATLALLGHEWGLPVDTAQAIERARLGRSGDDRERSFVSAVSTLVGSGADEGDRALLVHLLEHPRDAMTVSVVVPTIALGGMTRGSDSWELVEHLAPTYGDDWWYLGQLAFVRQDQGRFAEAEDLALRSLALQPRSGHAAHALSHVFYETGRHADGLAWLDRWTAEHGDWSDHPAHLAWHAGLHEVMLCDGPALARRWSEQLAPPQVSGLRVLVDSASLLWRAQVTGTWEDSPLARDLVASLAPEMVLRPTTPFAAQHAAFALAAAGDPAGLADLRFQAERCAWPAVARLSEGLSATLTERWDDAVELLRPLGVDQGELDGSAAQLDLIEETVIWALLQGGHRSAAAAVLEGRLARRPCPLDVRRLASATA